jgi:formate hydrogenlyase subunit 6/NADH:ubiquinone oxidoreductase subunit I
MKYPKLRDLIEAVTAILRGPVTTKYPCEPHIPFPRFRGKPVPHDEDCIGCGACAEVCPSLAIEVKDDLSTRPPKRSVIWHYDLCIYCQQCELKCTTKKGVTLSNEFDLATDDRKSLFSGVEKELVICEDCAEIIAPREQLLWMIKKLGPLYSGNFNLIYTSQKDLQLAENLASGLEQDAVVRPDLYRVLCPKCKHLVLVYNQTGKQP